MPYNSILLYTSSCNWKLVGSSKSTVTQEVVFFVFFLVCFLDF